MLKTTLIAAAKAGAAENLRFFNGVFKVSNKEGVNNLVTEADHAAEKAIIAVIKAQFPDHQVLAEESGELAQNSEYKWIIDPIDGTVNFAHGIPLNCVSIAVEHKGEIIMGAVYNPHLNEFFFAEKGKGATLNDKPIHVSTESAAIKACLVTGFPYTYYANSIDSIRNEYSNKTSLLNKNINQIVLSKTAPTATVSQVVPSLENS